MLGARSGSKWGKGNRSIRARTGGYKDSTSERGRAETNSRGRSYLPRRFPLLQMPTIKGSRPPGPTHASITSSTAATGSRPSGYHLLATSLHTLSIAREYGPQGVRANVICPAMIETAMLDGLTAERLTGILAGISLQRAGTTRESSCNQPSSCGTRWRVAVLYNSCLSGTCRSSACMPPT